MSFMTIIVIKPCLVQSSESVSYRNSVCQSYKNAVTVQIMAQPMANRVLHTDLYNNAIGGSSKNTNRQQHIPGWVAGISHSLLKSYISFIVIVHNMLTLHQAENTKIVFHCTIFPKGNLNVNIIAGGNIVRDQAYLQLLNDKISAFFQYYH